MERDGVLLDGLIFRSQIKDVGQSRKSLPGNGSPATTPYKLMPIRSNCGNIKTLYTHVFPVRRPSWAHDSFQTTVGRPFHSFVHIISHLL